MVATGFLQSVQLNPFTGPHSSFCSGDTVAFNCTNSPGQTVDLLAVAVTIGSESTGTAIDEVSRQPLFTVMRVKVSVTWARITKFHKESGVIWPIPSGSHVFLINGKLAGS